MLPARICRDSEADRHTQMADRPFPQGKQRFLRVRLEAPLRASELPLTTKYHLAHPSHVGLSSVPVFVLSLWSCLQAQITFTTLDTVMMRFYVGVASRDATLSTAHPRTNHWRARAVLPLKTDAI